MVVDNVDLQSYRCFIFFISQLCFFSLFIDTFSRSSAFAAFVCTTVSLSFAYKLLALIVRHVAILDRVQELFSIVQFF
jgi:hypothetical protein